MTEYKIQYNDVSKEYRVVWRSNKTINNVWSPVSEYGGKEYFKDRVDAETRCANLQELADLEDARDEKNWKEVD